MTRRPALCDVCRRPFLAHEKAEEKVPPMARHRFSTYGVPPRKVQDDLNIEQEES